MTDTLTLCKGKKQAAFDEMTLGGECGWTVERRKAIRTLYSRFPHLRDLKGDDLMNHDDYDQFIVDWDVEVTTGPLMRACWAGTGKPPTDAELRGSYSRELVACQQALVDRNPDLAPNFPGAQTAAAEEDADPNV